MASLLAGVNKVHMKKVIVTGGSGFIGTKLVEALLSKGYEIVILDITYPKIVHEHLLYIPCDLTKGEIPVTIFEDAYGVIHLAGRLIFGRWTKEFKEDIYTSRVVSTRRLVEVFRKTQKKPRVFISASAVGFYGDTKNELVNEIHEHGSDFLSIVCNFWESEAKYAEPIGPRTVQIRTAHVLGKGGLIKEVSRPFRFFVGGWFGNGKNWFPWVHYKDLVNIYIKALEDEKMHGSFNTAAPEKVTQKEFMKVLGRVLQSPAWVPIPLFIVRFVYKSFADILVVSQKIDSTKIISSGFTFEYPKLKEAIEDVLK